MTLSVQKQDAELPGQAADEAAVRSWLAETANRLLGCDCRGIKLDVLRRIERPKARILLFRLSCSHRKVQLCAKSFARVAADDLARQYRRGSQLQSGLRASDVTVPHYLAWHPETLTFVMDYVAGASLESRILMSLVGKAAARQDALAAIGPLAAAQIRLHAVPVSDDAPMAKPCSNEEYVRRLHELPEDAFAHAALSGAGIEPARVLDALPGAFWQRHEVALLHGDLQAKNVLVDDDGGIALIDLSYGYGHPFFDVAQFLVQLERLHRRRPQPAVRRRLLALGRAYLQALYSGALGHLRADLPFFLLWAYSYALRADRRHSFLARAYIRWHLQHAGFFQEWCAVKAH